MVNKLPWWLPIILLCLLVAGAGAAAGVLLPGLSGMTALLGGAAIIAMLFGAGLAFVAWLGTKGSGYENHAFDPLEFEQRIEAANLAETARAAEPAGVAGTEPERASQLAAGLRTLLGSAEQPQAFASRAALLKTIVQQAAPPAAVSERHYARSKDLLDKLQDRIGHEYDDVHTRTGWLLTAQAFLLGGLVAVTNAERLAAGWKQGLTLAIPAIGALIALVLSLAVFHGHALIAVLKQARGKAEQIMHRSYAIPLTGVPVHSAVHICGHFVTKALPAIAFIGWTGLMGLVWSRPESLRTESQLAAGAQLIAVRPSPVFPVGEAGFASLQQRCTSAEDTAEAAGRWARQLIEETWTKRPNKSTRDGIVLVGVADRTGLSGKLAARYDSNIGLARDRASAVRALLLQESQRLVPDNIDQLTPERIFVQVTGPSFTASTTARAPRADDCPDPQLSADRRVGVWIALR